MSKCNCNDPKHCQKPEDLKKKPESCSKDQVRKCHGDVKQHPCEKPRE